MKVVILDAGHGGVDGLGIYQTHGKRSPIWEDGSQYFEGEGNRIIAKIVSQYLRAAGWKVLFTVDPNNSKDIPLRERISISNKHYALNHTAFQISIHSNAYKKNIGQGAEVFISNNASKNSNLLAEIWKAEHLKAFNSLSWRGIKTSNFAMNRVDCPSILIESMFHSYEDECLILMSDKGKEKIAIAIAESCERFYASS